MSRARVFCSYAPRDARFLEELTIHLAALKKSGCIEMWSYRDIEVGKEERQQVSEALEDADVVLMLISADFIASEYCFDVEMARALELEESGGVVVLPILIRECDWESMPFARLYVWPSDTTPIAIMNEHERDREWADLARVLRIMLGRQMPFRVNEEVPMPVTKSSELMLLRFLEERWARRFNAARIRNWGGRQPGYAMFAFMTAEQIRGGLETLAREGLVKQFESATGSTAVPRRPLRRGTALAPRRSTATRSLTWAI